jgi:hypothetical protein
VTFRYDYLSLEADLRRSAYIDPEKGYSAPVSWFELCPSGYRRSSWFVGECTLAEDYREDPDLRFLDEPCSKHSDCSGNPFLVQRGNMACVEDMCQLAESYGLASYSPAATPRELVEGGGHSCMCEPGERSCVDDSCFGRECVQLQDHTNVFACRFPSNATLSSDVFGGTCSNCPHADNACFAYQASDFDKGADLEINLVACLVAAMVCMAGACVVPFSMYVMRLRRGEEEGEEGEEGEGGEEGGGGAGEGGWSGMGR